jgi:Tfp pilus assembly ATPase PilU
MPWWTDIFDSARRLGAEQMIFAVGRRVVIRRGTALISLGEEPLRPEQTAALVEAIAPSLAWRQLRHLGLAKFPLHLGTGLDFHVECHRFRGRDGLILRRIPERQPRSQRRQDS